MTSETISAAIRLDLPFPPSNHDVFKRHKGKFLSERYRKWRDDAGWLLKVQKPTPASGQVSITIELVAPDRRKRDCDNYTKGPLDLLVSHGIIAADDSTVVRSVTAKWADEGVPCQVIIRELAHVATS